MTSIPMWRRYARLFGADARADVEDELRFHLQAKVDELTRQGWDPAAAQAEAERQFGDVGEIRRTGVRLGKRREHRRERREWWETWAQDVRYAWRTLGRDRGFGAVVILILALGIGANTAVFSLVNTVLLRPLPFPEADRLAWFTSGRQAAARGEADFGLSNVTYTVAAYEEFQRHNQSFQQVASYNPFFGNSEYTLSGRGEPQAVAGVMVSQNFFQTLGLRPALGRLFVPEECRRGGRPAVLLSHAFWQRQFGGDPKVVGQTVVLSGDPATVVGVLPEGFDFGAVFSPGSNFEVFTPAVLEVMRRWGNTLAVVGRLKPGVTVAQAQAEADLVFPQLKAAHPEWWGDYTSVVAGLKEFVSGKLRRPLMVLWCAVGLILLIVCVNLSNLMLARAASRSREFAMRSALGAGRGRLFRQLLTESLLLASAGAVLGLALAFGITFYLARQGSIALPLLSSVKVDGAALAWTMLLAVAAAVVSGFVPGLRASSGNLQDALKDAGYGVSAGRGHERLRAALVVSEVALACVVLIGAGLLLRSFLRILDVDLGFQPSRAGVIKIDYPGGDGAKRGAALQEILRRVSAIPGVEAAGVTDMLPLGRNRSWGLSAKGKVYPRGTNLGAIVRIVTPGYLAAMGMRLESGRDFTWNDTPKSQPVVIINQGAARRFWPGEDPLWKMTTQGGQVIGVVTDVRAHSMEEAAGPEMFLAVTQFNPEGAELVVRSKLAPEALAGTLMKTLRALNPSQPATEFRPLRHIVDRAVSPRRFFVLLIGSFAGLGLVLACLGIYGVVSYAVTRRTQEIGIRMALGAGPAQVQAGVVGHALRLALIGIGVGALVSAVAARWIASLLYATRPTDPVTFAGIAALLAAVALAAGYIPARRASRIDPMTALRTN